MDQATLIVAVGGSFGPGMAKTVPRDWRSHVHLQEPRDYAGVEDLACEDLEDLEVVSDEVSPVELRGKSLVRPPAESDPYECRGPKLDQISDCGR